MQKCEIVLFCQDFITFDIYVNVLKQKLQFKLESEFFHQIQNHSTSEFSL